MMTKSYYINNIQLNPNTLENETIKDVKVTTELTSAEISLQSSSTTNILKELQRPRLLPQITAAVLACWINLSTGASLGYITPALPSLQESGSRLRISNEEGSWLAGIILLGALLGGFLAGPCISLGRRKTLWFSAVPLASAWILVATASNVPILYLAHLIFGTCLGIVSDASQLYVSESASKQWRGALGCVPVLMFNVGMLMCYVAGAWLSWENLAIFGAILTVPAMFLPLALPETPSYLVAQGNVKEAIAALHWLRGAKWDITSEYQELANCEKGPSLISRMRELAHREIMLPILITLAIRALSRFTGLRAIQSYIHKILEQSQSQSSIDNRMATIITGAVQFIATLIACLLLDKLGRRRLLIASQVIMGISMFGLACWLFFRKDVNVTDGFNFGWTPVMLILVYIAANSIGIGPVSGILIGELVPQRHRSIASSITGSVSWLSAFVVTKTFLDIQEGLHLYGTLWLYGSICLLGVPFIYFCLPETRGISQYGIEMLYKQQNHKAIQIR